MKYKQFTLAILFRLLILILFSGLSVFFFFKMKAYFLSGISTIATIITLSNTIHYFNQINRWIGFFLLGIENEDTTLKIPKKTGSKVLDDVFKGMDRLNEIFKQTKVEISTQEQYYRSVINQSATGLFSIDEKGRIINLNPAAAKLTGLIQYHHVNTLNRIDESLPMFLNKKGTDNQTISAIYENSKAQKLLFKVSEIETQKEIIRLVAVSDITKELDNREVDAWIKLARTLSHEIMNNIAPITTLSQVIHNYYIADNKPVKVESISQKVVDNTAKGLEVIEERSAGLLNFVENYRKFTKLPEPKVAPCNICDLLENVLLSCTAFKYYDKTQVLQHFDEELTCSTDSDLLSQVMINLIKNALEALDENQCSEPKLWISASKVAGEKQIEIRNNGGEIPPEMREQIFVPFFTTKETGTGIGLSLSKQIMLKMGGDLNLKKDKVGQTTFILTLL